MTGKNNWIKNKRSKLGIKSLGCSSFKNDNAKIAKSWSKQPKFKGN
jgi:hypothetical protein